MPPETSQKRTPTVGFDDIVICARIKRLLDNLVRAHCREHENRTRLVGMLLAQRFENAQTVNLWHVEVQQHHVEIRVLRGQGNRLFAIGSMGDLVVPCELPEKQASEHWVVFGDQTVEFVRGLDSITLTIFDATTGTTTEVVVPIFTTGG
mgnify:CR=1 FL=1